MSACALAALLGLAPSALAGWYWGSANGFPTLPLGQYTTSGGWGGWTFGAIDNANFGTQKAFTRIRSGAGGATWYASSYGYPTLWSTNYSTSGTSYSYGQNGGPGSSGPINVRAGQF